MLLVQQISLTWSKSDRGGAPAGARAGFARAYPFVPGPVSQTAKPPAKKAAEAPEGSRPGALVKQLWFRQDGVQLLNGMRMARKTLQAALLRLGCPAKQIGQVMARRPSESPERWQTAAGPEKLDLVNISFYPQAEGLAVRFYWDERRSGVPCRRGHNEDFGNPAARFCGKDCLNETAFLLAPGQYGRLLWNERRSAEDGWYYQLHLYNLYFTSEGVWTEDVFTCRQPDIVYSQLAELY